MRAFTAASASEAVLREFGPAPASRAVDTGDDDRLGFLDAPRDALAATSEEGRIREVRHHVEVGR